MWFAKTDGPDLIYKKKEDAIKAGLVYARKWSKKAVFDPESGWFLWSKTEREKRVPVLIYGREDACDNKFYLYDKHNQLIGSFDTLRKLMDSLKETYNNARLKDPFYDEHRWNKEPLTPYVVEVQNKSRGHYKTFGYIQHKGYPFIYCDVIYNHDSSERYVRWNFF